MSMSITPKPSNPRVSSGPGGSNTTQACAACKYQRRKCTPTCPLLPFFPPDRQQDFLNAHKLFGVSNIKEILRTVEPFDRENAAKSMIFQANARATDPVGGCYRIICELERRFNYAKAELDFVLHQLAACREMQNPSFYDPLQNPTFQCFDQQNYVHGQMGFNVEGFGGMKVDGEASSGCSMVVEGKQQDFVDESEDIKPFLGIFDEAFESKEPIQSSDKVVISKEDVANSVQPEQENDLKIQKKD